MDRGGRPRVLVGGVLVVVVVVAQVLLPWLAAVAPPGAVASLVAWGAAGWARRAGRCRCPGSTGCWNWPARAARSPSR
ncbi:hypothetical protein ACH4Q6_26400 [Streptomyces lydicus]|uniref:hypothetical protein n=1 Tax=Streptomyces lydicus TaxID=47763 RepID=UPI003793AF5E